MDWLGLEYASIDIDGTAGSIPLDLNYDEVPVELAGRYHLVTSLGTTEHTANQVQAFKIIRDLASVDAVMLHNVPAGGMINHGLISYNPRFFWRLARSNGYKTLYMSMSCLMNLRSCYQNSSTSWQDTTLASRLVLPHTVFQRVR